MVTEVAVKINEKIVVTLDRELDCSFDCTAESSLALANDQMRFGCWSLLAMKKRFDDRGRAVWRVIVDDEQIRSRKILTQTFEHRMDILSFVVGTDGNEDAQIWRVRPRSQLTYHD